MRFEHLLHTGLPDMSAYGFARLNIASEGAFYAAGENHWDEPTDAKLAEVAAAALQEGPPLCVNLEQWSEREPYASTAERLTTIEPTLTWGYYGVMPHRDYWNAVTGPNATAYRGWQAENSLRAIAVEHVSVLFPSLYTFYADEAGWRKYAIANVREARRISNGKPVYAFLWPQYHESNQSLGYALIPGSSWRVQLDTLKWIVDGVVIWGGFTYSPGFTPMAWDENAEWWAETKSFFSIV